MKKLSIEDQINGFLNDFDLDDMRLFLEICGEVFFLFDVDQDDDWIEKKVGAENCSNIRLIKSVYLISKMSEFFAGRLCIMKMKYPQLYKKMEKETKNEND